MKSWIAIIVFFMLLNNLKAQPWKITRDFKLAFQSSYEDYKLYTKKKGDRVYCIAFNKSNSLKKVFDFEMLGNNKDGWFNRIDTSNKNSYSIFFEAGVAKRLSYISTDSSLFSFTIDSNLLNGVHTVYYPNGNIKEYGFYKNNARVGVWRFYNKAGKVVSEGNFMGDYNKLVYDVKKYKLITLNKYLDTIKVESFSQKKYDSLKVAMNQKWGIAFPVQLNFKIGEWKYYNEASKLIKEELYERGKLVSVKNEQQ